MTEWQFHHGEDYSTLTSPLGAEYLIKYPSDEDRLELEHTVAALNNLLEEIDP